MRTCNKCNIKKTLQEFRANRKTCKQCNYEYAKNYFSSETGKEYRRIWQENKRRQQPTVGMLTAARARAKTQNVPFNITIEDIVVPEYCPVLGIKLEFNVNLSKDNSPTLDKIIPELGYIKGNIAVISKRANTIKSNASYEEIQKLLDWLGKVNGNSSLAT